MKNTIFFLFADHGQAFYQHIGNFNHRKFIYEENVHVPFLIYSKDFFKTTKVYDGISSHIDILPTILDILQIKNQKRMEGVSIFSRHEAQLALLHTNWKDDYLGVRDGKWKYIYKLNNKFEELYDLSLDKNEKNNIASKNRSVRDGYRTYILKSRKYRLKFYDDILE